MSSKKIFIIIVLLVFFLISTQIVQSEIPKTMYYRSSLIKSNGFPYTVGTYNIRFEIVDNNDVILWQEEHIIEIKFFYVNVYEVLLGETNPINLPFDEDYRIKVIDITAPRDYLVEEKPLASIGYAYRAEYCNFADAFTQISDIKVIEAKNADYALEAGHAATADNATNADHAAAADTATTSSTADYATTAGDADTIDGKYAGEFIDTSANIQTKLGSLNVQGSVGIGTTSPQAKLDVEGTVQAYEFDTRNIVFRKGGEKLWRISEDEKGLYLENLKTGDASRIFLEKDVEMLRAKNKELEERLTKIEAMLSIGQGFFRGQAASLLTGNRQNQP